jgi:SNF2 family DNA or RNA helicase
MWVYFTNIYLNNVDLNNISKIVIDYKNRLRLIKKNNTSHEAQAHNSLYAYYDLITNMIIYHYMHTRNDINRLIDIKYEDGITKIYININVIDNYINMPILNSLCNIYIRDNSNSTSINYITPIDNISFIPNIIIDNKLFSKINNNFNIKLFDYQKKTIMKMIQIENNIDMSFDRNINIKIKNDNYEKQILWDPHNDKIVDKPSKTYILSSGGILADTMGLGKTITTIGLMHYGKTLTKEEVNNSDRIYSKATIVIVPSHLAKQWVEEYMKAHKDNKKIIVMLTKVHHDKTTYKDIVDADIIIVTNQFLLNLKNYGSINYNYATMNYYNIDDRYKTIFEYYKLLITEPNYLDYSNPLFEYFHFNRVIIDEGHELMENENNNSNKTNRFIHSFIRNIKCNYKWYISGTPFTTISGLLNIFNYLNVKIVIDDEIIDMLNIHNVKIPDNAIIYPYLLTDKTFYSILSNITIRHLKDDVKDNINLLGYSELIEWVELTNAERNIYESKLTLKDNEYILPKNKSERRLLQQICCHPLVAESFKKIIGNKPVSLEEVQDKIIEHHNNNIKTYTKKIEKLDKTNQAYGMLLSKYKSIITESRFVLNTLEKINETIDIKEDNNCIICYDEMKDPILTPCGHLYCNRCINMCLKMKPECPMCKSNIAPGSLVSIKGVDKEKIIDNVNPLIAKYGSKLGKLIQITRTLLAQDARVIIFSQWDEMLLLIRKSLIENEIDCSFISGNVYKRNKAISRFKLGGKDNSVILLSLENSASGTNLTEATHIIIVEPVDNTKENIIAIEGQAIGRAVRLGQKQVIQIIRILCKNTIEEEIYNSKYIVNNNVI